MVDLTVHDVLWSREQGHPVLVMSAESKAAGSLSIVLSPSDAQMLASKPLGPSVERSRLMAVIEGIVRGLNARFTEVRFRLDPRMVLTADLRLEHDLRPFSVPANFADAVALAVRAGIPMRISEQDLRWIRALQEPASAQPSDLAPDAMIADFIESLQLDDLRGTSHDRS